MKNLLYLFAVILVLMPGLPMAQEYAADFGQDSSFETGYTMTPGDTVKVDLYVTDLPENLVSDGVWLTYDNTMVEITAIDVTDGGSGGNIGGTGPVSTYGSVSGC